MTSMTIMAAMQNQTNRFISDTHYIQKFSIIFIIYMI